MHLGVILGSDKTTEQDLNFVPVSYIQKGCTQFLCVQQNLLLDSSYNKFVITLEKFYVTF